MEHLLLLRTDPALGLQSGMYDDDFGEPTADAAELQGAAVDFAVASTGAGANNAEQVSCFLFLGGGGF